MGGISIFRWGLGVRIYLGRVVVIDEMREIFNELILFGVLLVKKTEGNYFF